jgi:predicted NACHT family NTPase
MSFMSRQEDIQTLINEHTRHLQKLQEQKAKFGSLHAPAHLLTEIEDTEAEIEKLRIELKEGGVLPPAVELERYLRAVRDQQAVLDLSIFQERQERELAVVRLDEFYVPLRLAGQDPLGARREGQARRQKGELAQLRSELLSTHLLASKNHLNRHLALLGDAGSGKTTLLRQLCGALAHARLADDKLFARAWTGYEGEINELPVPLFVPLRHYHHHCRTVAGRPLSRGSFLEFLALYFRDHYDLELETAFYRSLLNSGQLLLALDGFDEVPDLDSRQQVVAVVRSLAADS